MKNYAKKLYDAHGIQGAFSPNITKKQILGCILWPMIFPLYLTLFSLAEKLITQTDYWVSYLPIDDYIPFVEHFVIFYVFWYAMLAATGLYLLFFNVDGLKRYCLFIGITFIGTLIFCALFPNGQDLRVDIASLGRDNVFLRLVGALYSVDTNTNVLPSMHVLGCFGIIFAFLEEPEFKKHKLARAIVVVLNVLVMLSTVFLKQHSILDGIVAVPVAAIVYFIVYKLIK